MRDLKAFWKEVRQFFEEGTGQLSMTRLLQFLSFFPASYLAVRIGNENSLTILVAAYGGAYIAGKWLDRKLPDMPPRKEEKPDGNNV